MNPLKQVEKLWKVKESAIVITGEKALFEHAYKAKITCTTKEKNHELYLCLGSTFPGQCSGDILYDLIANYTVPDKAYVFGISESKFMDGYLAALKAVIKEVNSNRKGMLYFITDIKNSSLDVRLKNDDMFECCVSTFNPNSRNHVNYYYHKV